MIEPKHVIIFAACCLPFLVADVTDPDAPLDDATCQGMLEDFANLSSKYTYCAIRHARPIKVCQACIVDYLKVLNIYDDITQVDSKGGRKCASELASLDRLEIFENGIKYIEDMWRKAYCDTCFIPDPTKGRPTSVLTPMVQNMLTSKELYDDCIKQHHNESSPKPDLETCSLCVPEYDKLNGIYTSFKTETGVVEFCMDIVDLVNSTRNQWSDSIGCCRARRQTELAFVFATTGICVLPVLFYLMTYAFTAKKEHNVIERKRPYSPSSNAIGTSSTTLDGPEHSNPST